MATVENHSCEKRIPSAAADGGSKVGDDEDLLVEVLIRLPDPSSAWRCKLVCKRWNSLISAPYFSRRFVSHHQSLSAGGPSPSPQLPSKVRELISNFLPLSAPFEFRILDCFKDLLLLGPEVPVQYSAYPELRRTYLVCNPFTKQLVALPLAPERRSSWQTLVAKLVCKPCNSAISLDLSIDGARGEEEEEAAETEAEVSSTYHSGYRFRVVLMPFDRDSQVDVFCSESGEWTKVFLHGLRGDLELEYTYMVSVDGELYWENSFGEVVGWNTFCLDGTPPAIISQLHDAAHLWTSQGALYMILLELEEDEEDEEARFGYSKAALSVWKMEKEGSSSSSSNSRRSWRRHYEVSLSKLSCEMMNGIEWLDMRDPMVVGQDRLKPEIVLLECVFPPDMHETVLFSCNLKTGELELFPDQRGYHREQILIQSTYDLWPTRVPAYEKLCGMYDGSYPFLQGKPME